MKNEKVKDSLQLISSKEFTHYDDMYKIVDYLNKNLRDTNIIIGLSEKDNSQCITIYKEN